MTALNRNPRYFEGPFKTASYAVADGVTIAETDIFIGMASSGYVGPASTGTYNKLVGLLVPQGRQPLPIVGSTSTSPPPEVVVTDDGIMLMGVPVTGVTAVTNHGAAVYASDSKTLTLTKGSNVQVGWIKRFISTGVADVRVLSRNELLISTVQA